MSSSDGLEAKEWLRQILQYFLYQLTGSTSEGPAAVSHPSLLIEILQLETPPSCDRFKACRVAAPAISVVDTLESHISAFVEHCSR